MPRRQWYLNHGSQGKQKLNHASRCCFWSRITRIKGLSLGNNFDHEKTPCIDPVSTLIAWGRVGRERCDRDCNEWQYTSDETFAAEDKHWHQPGTSKMRPSSIVKFPHLLSRRQMLPDRGSVSFSCDPRHRRPLDESRRGSDPFHGTAAQQKPQFHPRVGAGR